jgi:CRP-like cAMP-binding protein
VEHKGRDCGLTKEDLVYLMQNPPFLQALREIMKNQLRSSEVAITAKMTGAALRGDVTASRIVLERVDKYDDVAKDKLKFQEVVTILVDAIQKHVRDPKVLENIMKDIKVVILAIEGAPPT